MIEFKPVKTLPILEAGGCLFEDSIMWYLMEDNNTLGYCYNVYTGEKISMIGTIGKAAYELTSFPDFFSFVGDSLQFYTARKEVKSFSKNEIINNVPIAERYYSVTSAPDSISVCNFVKLPSGYVIATVSSTLGKLIPRYNNSINCNQIVVYNSNEVKSYNIIDYNSLGIDNMNISVLPKGITAEEAIETSYSNGDIRVKGSDKAVFSVSNQFMLYTFDINKGEVVNKRNYTEMKLSRNGSTTNDMGMSIMRMEASDKYILCFVEGYFSMQDKDSKLRKTSLFVFDWDLNPVKRFEIPALKNKDAAYHTISIDCTTLYLCEFTEEGIVVSKANLN